MNVKQNTFFFKIYYKHNIPILIRYHQGTTVVVHNIRDLRAGEAITENYGPIFAYQPKEERRRTLKTR